MTTHTTDTVNDCWNRIGIWRTGSEVCNRLEDAIHCHNCDIYKQAGLGLLDRALPDHYKSNNTLAFSAEKEHTETDKKSLLIFRHGNEWYAISSHILDEVCSDQPVHALPHKPSQLIRGLVNIRGEIEICISLENLLSYNSYLADEKQLSRRIIVIQLDIGRFAFIADEVSGIYRIVTDKIQPPPTSVKTNKHSLVAGMIEHNNYQVGILSVSHLENLLAVL